MNYRKDLYGNDLSVLGFGCMRFAKKGAKTDMLEVERELLTAIRAGINYFDTAYVYPGSEAALGEILAKHNLRERVYIATKLPHYLIKKSSDLDRIFNEQLARLKTDYIDYYLIHMLSDIASWERLRGLGIEEWIEKKKKSGKIRQIGFSFHGSANAFREVLDAYSWEFCQIQYNYLDENSQAGRRGLHYAAKKGLPVIIMEPLRGGRLADKLPKKAKKIFEKHEPKRSPAEWAFHWLWDQPEVTCVLSGMNSMEMLRENIRAACRARAGGLNDAGRAMFADVVAAINAKMKVPCTGCGYCMPCPADVDIPGAFAAYNRRYTDSRFWGFIDYTICTALRQNGTGASGCKKCGKCEPHCPQGIAIREELTKVQKTMEGPVYRIVRGTIKKFKLF